METLVEKLGLDWKLLLSQAVNFIILLTVLRLTVYKPLLNLLNKRRKTIEEGLAKAAEADKRLSEISELQKEKIKEAQAEGQEIIRGAENKAKTQEQKILAAAAQKESELLKRASEKAEAQRLEALHTIENEAVGIVRRILEKTVSLSPDKIDDSLIEKAAKEHQLAR
jgi:F-type H+-transporting ATPase subunit b